MVNVNREVYNVYSELRVIKKWLINFQHSQYKYEVDYHPKVVIDAILSLKEFIDDVCRPTPQLWVR